VERASLYLKEPSLWREFGIYAEEYAAAACERCEKGMYQSVSTERDVLCARTIQSSAGVMLKRPAEAKDGASVNTSLQNAMRRTHSFPAPERVIPEQDVRDKVHEQWYERMGGQHRSRPG